MVGSMMIKHIFRRRTLLELAGAELAEADLGLLQAHSAREYAEAMATYQAARIKRLRAYIAAQTKEAP